LHDKTHYERQNVCNFLYKSRSGQIVVQKEKSVNAKFYKGMFLQKEVFQKPSTSNWSPWCQVVARQRFVTQSSHCTRLSEAEKVLELPHPPYSPELAPYDFFLFLKLNKHVAGRKYQTRIKLGSAILVS
jgi:histone-lysine N-methyltransferase SETMAR